ncbi:hypothetical protein HDU98_001745 [Podochytrium sp. JEL0797]|nr:hypothetical protein HDU98_001745 [Podochytrium sp. JEL0797]
MMHSQGTEEVYETGPSSPLPVGRRRTSTSASSEADEGFVFSGDIETASLVPSLLAAQRVFGPASQRGGTAASSGSGSGGGKAARRGSLITSSSLSFDEIGAAAETPLQTLRRLLFETKDLVDDLLRDAPPAAENLVTSDIHQLRKTAAKVDDAAKRLDRNNAPTSALQRDHDLALLHQHIENARQGIVAHTAPQHQHPAAPRSYAAALSPKANPTSPAVSPIPASMTVGAPLSVQTDAQQQQATTNSALQYDLYFQSGPSTSNMLFADDLLHIEQRISALERLVGNSAAPSSTSLLDDIQELDSTLTLLTTPHALARLSRRIQTITSQIDRTIRLRRRILAKHQRLRDNTSSSSSDEAPSDPEDDDADYSLEKEGGSSSPTKESAVTQLIDLELSSRRAEDEKRVGYLFSTLTDRLDPLSNTIPDLLTRLKGLALLNAEISAGTVRETVAGVEKEQGGVVLEKLESVRDGMGRCRAGIREGAKEGAGRFDEMEKRVRELVQVIEERFGGRPMKGAVGVPVVVQPVVDAMGGGDTNGN